MEEENEDFKKQIRESLVKHQRKINELTRRIDILEEYTKYLQKYRDLPMARTTVDKNGRKLV